MEFPSSSSRSSSFSHRHRHRHREEMKFVSAIISPAISGKTCSICLTPLHDHHRAAVITVCLHAYCLHCIRRWSEMKRRCPLCNAEFDSWYCRISLSARRFATEKLPLPTAPAIARSFAGAGIRRGRFVSRNALRTAQNDNRISQPLPRRRTFAGGERRLQWRESIYKQCLRAIPMADSSRGRPKYTTSEGMLQRIEPWIRRELQSVLDDPDPSVIVHVASSLFIESVERKSDFQSGGDGVVGDFLVPIRRFLGNWAYTFWHELRCFAESSLNMETYDEVVDYAPSREFDEIRPPRIHLLS